MQAEHGDMTRVDGFVLNYRYQLWGGEADQKLAIAPRVSVMRIGSANGIQVNIPISVTLGERLASHSNIGATRYRNGAHDLDLAQSFIYALSARVHPMFETSWVRSAAHNALVISPGVRWAYNRPNRLQIVPGLAVPIERGRKSILCYVSFEHPIR